MVEDDTIDNNAGEVWLDCGVLVWYCCCWSVLWYPVHGCMTVCWYPVSDTKVYNSQGSGGLQLDRIMTSSMSWVMTPSSTALAWQPRQTLVKILWEIWSSLAFYATVYYFQNATFQMKTSKLPFNAMGVPYNVHGWYHWRAGKGLHYRQFSSRVRTQESLCINMPSTIHVHTPLVEHIHTALVEHSCTNHPTRSRCVLICSQPCTFIAYACTNTFTLRWWNTFTALALVRTIRVTCNELAL